MTEAPSQAVTAAAIQGDTWARRELLAYWSPVVLRWCSWMGSPGSEPEDVAHDALVQVLGSLGSLREPGAFPGWLFRITQRTMARHRRRAWLQPWRGTPCIEPVDEGEDPLARAERLEAQDQVRSLLAGLPAKLRTVLVLCVIEERSSAEAAQLLSVPHGTAKSRLRKAKQLLQQRARQRFEEPQALADGQQECSG